MRVGLCEGADISKRAMPLEKDQKSDQTASLSYYCFVPTFMRMDASRKEQACRLYSRKLDILEYNIGVEKTTQGIAENFSDYRNNLSAWHII